MCTTFDETFVKVHINNEELTHCIESEKASEYFKSHLFKCNKCVLVFSDQKIFLKHNLIFHKDGKLICDICNSRISNKRHLLSHLRKHYVVYRCVVCQFVCRKEMRLWHFETEHKKVFQCVKCKLQFRWVAFLFLTWRKIFNRDIKLGALTTYYATGLRQAISSYLQF